MGRTKELFMKNQEQENRPPIEEENQPKVDTSKSSNDYIIHRLIDAMVDKSEPSTSIQVLRMISGYQDEYKAELTREIEKLKAK